jgi:hypothetical protein
MYGLALDDDGMRKGTSRSHWCRHWRAARKRRAAAIASAFVSAGGIEASLTPDVCFKLVGGVLAEVFAVGTEGCPEGSLKAGLFGGLVGLGQRVE